jgi:hypothetical protein
MKIYFPLYNLFPRGYDSVRYEQFIKGSADYKFPVINLSYNIWKILYFKRLNTDIFYDHGAGKTETGYDYFRSAGFELTAEQHPLSNLYIAIEAGFRYAYCFDTSEKKYELYLLLHLIDYYFRFGMQSQFFQQTIDLFSLRQNFRYQNPLRDNHYNRSYYCPQVPVKIIF